MWFQGTLDPLLNYVRFFVAIHSHILVTKFGRNPIKYDVEEKADCPIFDHKIMWW